MQTCPEHTWLVKGLWAVGGLVMAILGSIWYQNLILFPQLEAKVSDQINVMKTDVSILQIHVAELKSIHPMGDKK